MHVVIAHDTGVQQTGKERQIVIWLLSFSMTSTDSAHIDP